MPGALELIYKVTLDIGDPTSKVTLHIGIFFGDIPRIGMDTWLSRSMATNESALPYDVQSDQGIPVTLPSGNTFYCLTSNEERYLTERIRRYLSDNHFVNISDVADLDNMVTFELLMHRWSLWLSKGRDYYDEDISIKLYSDMLNNYSTELRQLKKSLGVDKSTRDKTRGDDSVAAYWDNLKRRAQEFGYMRNEQFAQVITAFKRIQAMVQFYENCDSIERKENACEIDDVLDVIREEISKFDLIDEEFRFNVQTMWIRQQ